MHELIQAYGLWLLFGIILVENVGIPLPGETALVTAALYAGATHRFTVAEVILVAAAAAVLGGMGGFAIGRSLGLRLLVRYGRYIRLSENRLKVGEYLFWKHGGKIVFFGRFVALLRVLASLLAGANRMSWPRFALVNALGGVGWAALFGAGAYFLGDRLQAVEGPIAIGLGAAAAIAVIGALVFFHRYEQQVTARALEAMRHVHRKRECR
jgi:membrane protein DedA with SNARE-associated domain